MLRVKNWKKFQHFNNRRPPWIKLYRDILDDIEWHKLSPEAAKALVMIWLIASESDDGVLPSIEELAFRIRTTETKIKSIISGLSHWIEVDDIKAISGRYQSDPLEREREGETEKEREIEGEGSERTAGPPSFPLPFQPEGFNSESETDGITGSNGHRLATNGSVAGLDPALQAILAECPHLTLISTGASSTFWDQVLAICEPYPQAGPAWLNAKIRKWNQWFEDHKGRRSRKREFLQSRIMRWLEKDLEHLAMRKS